MKDITNYLEKNQVDIMLEAAATSSTRDYLIIRMLWRAHSHNFQKSRASLQISPMTRQRPLATIARLTVG